MTQLGDALDPQGDVLVSGTAGRSRWWTLLDSGPEQAVDRAAESRSADPPQDRVIEPVPAGFPSTDRADQLTYVDDAHGFLVQYGCPLSDGDSSCPRRILATSDGGASWEARGRIPDYAEHSYQLAAASQDELMLIGATLASMTRSVDGGRSWSQLPVTLAEAATAPIGATLVQSAMQCEQVCHTTLGWIDAAAQELHPLPRRPAAVTGDFQGRPSMSSDGDIVIASVADSAGLVSMSTDGGQAWTDTRLEIPLDPAKVDQFVQVWAAGGGRAYALVQVYDGVNDTDSTYGFRTDNGGLTWADLGLVDRAVGLSDGVIDGELITTDMSGQISVSSAGGTSWDEVSIDGRSCLSLSLPEM